MLRSWMKEGNHWVWFNAMALAISLLAVTALVGLLAVKGIAHFWPKDVIVFTVDDGKGSNVQLIGERQRTGERLEGDATVGVKHIPQTLVKIGGRELFGADFKWVDDPAIVSQETPNNMVVIERYEWGNLYGRLVSITNSDGRKTTGDAAWDSFKSLIAYHGQLYEQLVDIQKDKIGSINYAVEGLRLERRRLELKNALTDADIQRLAQERKDLDQKYELLLADMQKLQKLSESLGVAELEVMGGKLVQLPVSKVVAATMPNAMGAFAKTGEFFHKIWEFLSTDPREANTEGGIFPAIFGTVTLVFIMTFLVMPFGVMAAVYLREYAKDGVIVRMVRVSVNNLAGVPSIVYGVFGLGFFVYIVGQGIDHAFYQEALPSPTFGTSGLLWAALTLALLTLPVVIVSTEEGLARVPRAIREGSLALGATKIETLWRTVLPMASPAIMTGLILAIARAAGEVAPLMLVGVVKLAPSLPVDGNAPFVHLDQKIMHLGFHIHDVGFQSPNIEAAQPLVYATAFLLVLIVISLNISAIAIRNRLRERFKSLDN